jgi:hypothetical protein
VTGPATGRARDDGRDELDEELHNIIGAGTEKHIHLQNYWDIARRGIPSGDLAAIKVSVFAKRHKRGIVAKPG